MTTNGPKTLNQRWVSKALCVAVVGAGMLVGSGVRALDDEIQAPPQRDPAGGMEAAARNGSQVYVDDSFASVDKLRSAIRHAKQEQEPLAIKEFQEIIDNFGQKLVFLSDNSYVSITDYVRERLVQMPAVRQGMYDQIFGENANQAVKAATDERDISALLRACDRFYPSTAALAGLMKAGEWYFERGEFIAASRTWQTLLQHPLAGKQRPIILFRAAAAEALARNISEVKRLRAQLDKEFPDAEGPISGQDVKLVEALDKLTKLPAWEQVDLSREEWPAFQGGPTRTRLMEVNATIGARLWGVTYATRSAEVQRPDGNVRIRRISSQGLDDSDGPPLSSFAVLSNGSIFVHTGDRIVAVSANAGAQLWSYPQTPQPRMDAAAEQRYINSYGYIPRISAHDSPTVFGDQVFAVLPATRAGTVNRSNPFDLANGRVVCLSREDGKELWSRSPDDIKINQAGQARPVGSISFVGSPTVTRQGIYVMARRMAEQSFVQQYLVRLDRETGEVTWTCYLCSTSTGNMYGNGMNLGNVSVPAIVDDIVYIATGQGADCAVDANAGRILWLRVNESGNAGKEMERAMMYQPAPISASWKYNPPIITADKMIATDVGFIRIYRRNDGKLLKTVKPADVNMTRFDAAPGMIGSRMIVSGDKKTIALDLSELDRKAPKDALLKTVWEVNLPDIVGNPQGRPFLTGGFYYIPYEKKLVRINVQREGTSENWDWPTIDGDTPGKPGNLLITGEQVIVVTDTEIAGYSKWETALANRKAKIAEAPDNPEPHLSLAEISYRTNHWDLGQEQMKLAVDLANAADATAKSGGTTSGTPGTMLARLYRTNLTFAEQLLRKSDITQRDLSRFYYEQCKSAARDPEQQSEWRMRLAELSLKQKRPDEAATLYNEVLTDPALRRASYKEGDSIASAGATAEQRLRKLIVDHGATIYRRFEDQAVAMLQKARTGRDLAALQQVMEGYPNSSASVAAGTDLAAAYRDKKEWENARKVLWWLQPRTQGDAQARVIADLVTVSIELKKLPSAAAWAARGLRQYKDAVITRPTGEKVTFADIREQVAALGAADLEGRSPSWQPTGMSGTSPTLEWETPPISDKNLLKGSRLLAPVETSPSLRRPNLLFTLDYGTLHIYDTEKGEAARPPVRLPQVNANTVLLGATPDTAVLLQASLAMGVDIKSGKTWMVNIRRPSPSGRGTPAALQQPVRQNVVIINGNAVVVGPNGNVVLDEEGNPIVRNEGDPDLTRLRQLQGAGQVLNYSYARLMYNRLLLLSGNQLLAYDIRTGEPAWKDASGGAITVTLPEGAPVSITGNEDIIVAQVDSPDGTNSTFYAIDADTGRFRKQFKFENDRAEWRTVADDGRLFAASSKTIAAYDLIGDNNRPLWKGGIDTRFATATALTMDGLMVVDSAGDVSCLSLESGEMLWTNKVQLVLGLAQGQGSVLRASVEGDAVLYQSNRGLQSVPSGGKGWWNSTPLNAPAPPLQGFQLSSNFIVELAMGAVGNTPSGAMLVVLNRTGGKLTKRDDIVGRNGETSAVIRNWQVLDNGVALDVNGAVHFWRVKKGQ